MLYLLSWATNKDKTGHGLKTSDYSTLASSPRDEIKDIENRNKLLTSCEMGERV